MILKMALALVMGMASTQTHAQGWLKKLGKGLEDGLKGAGKALDVAAQLTDESGDSVTVNGVKTLKWDAIPKYTAQKVIDTDDNGQPLLNADGTQKYHVFLVDQFGNRRSKEAVEAQQTKLYEALKTFLANEVTGATSAGGGKTVAEKLGNGFLKSKGEVKMALKQQKSLNQQKKLLEAYSKTFTDEGTPIDAKVDLSRVDGLDLKDDNTLSMTASDIKKELESGSFNTTDDSAWDF